VSAANLGSAPPASRGGPVAPQLRGAKAKRRNADIIPKEYLTERKRVFQIFLVDVYANA
jgi:hypothetical protein